MPDSLIGLPASMVMLRFILDMTDVRSSWLAWALVCILEGLLLKLLVPGLEFKFPCALCWDLKEVLPACNNRAEYSHKLDEQKRNTSVKQIPCAMMSYDAVILLNCGLILNITKVMISSAETTFQRKTNLDMTCNVVRELCWRQFSLQSQAGLLEHLDEVIQPAAHHSIM